MRKQDVKLKQHLLRYNVLYISSLFNEAMDDGLLSKQQETTCKEAVMAWYKALAGICLKGMRKTTNPSVTKPVSGQRFEPGASRVLSIQPRLSVASVIPKFQNPLFPDSEWIQFLHNVINKLHAPTLLPTEPITPISTVSTNWHVFGSLHVNDTALKAATSTS